MGNSHDVVNADRLKVLLVWLSGMALGLFAISAAGNLIRYDRPLDVAPYMNRYAQLQPYLRDHSVVGYMSDATSWELARRSRLVQYALVPVLVDLTPACCEVLIGDFVSAAPPEVYAIEHDFGRGLYLLRERPSSP